MLATDAGMPRSTTRRMPVKCLEVLLPPRTRPRPKQLLNQLLKQKILRTHRSAEGPSERFLKGIATVMTGVGHTRESSSLAAS